MSSTTRRGGIPGPENRTALMRPSMTEAEFERRLGTQVAAIDVPTLGDASDSLNLAVDFEPVPRAPTAPASRSRSVRVKPAKPRRVQRMFAIEEDLDKKLWLYAIHSGKDRSEVVNDLLRPIVASMVLYDSRDRRSARGVDLVLERSSENDSDSHA
jgi:hypothetical protein